MGGDAGEGIEADAHDQGVRALGAGGGFNVGGEQSGHMILTDHATTGDGTVAALSVLSSMVRTGKPASELLHVFDRVPQLLKNVRYEGGAPLENAQVKQVIAEAESAGVIERAEQTMISGVMRLGDRTARALMTPRTEVEMIDASLPGDELKAALLATTHTRIPVHEGSIDAVIGVARVRDAVAGLFTDPEAGIAEHVRSAPVVPDTMTALSVLETLQKADVPVALVHDEFGHFAGLITPADILDAIAGAFRSDEEDAEPEARQRADGSWLISGAMPADEMAELLYLELPERRGYDTVAGFLLDAFKRLPQTGDTIEMGNWRFEVVDLDGRRIDKVLAERQR